MSQFKFVAIWSFNLPGTENFVQPMGSNYAFSPEGRGKGTDPANCYNVYQTPTLGAFILQSQLNGMYIGMPAGQSLVCAAIPDQAHAQPLIPTNSHGNFILWLPDKVHFLGLNYVGSGYVWQTNHGGYTDLYPGILSLRLNWTFGQSLEDTGGLTLRYVNLDNYVFPLRMDLTGIDFSGAILDGATFDQCNLTNANFTSCSLQKASLRNAIFVGTIFNKATLTGAKLRGDVWTNVKAIGATLDEADFTEATFRKTDLTGAALNKTILNDATFGPVDFSNCDLTSIEERGVTAISTQAQPLIFNNAKLNFPLINLNWQCMDLRNATVNGLPQPLSSAASPLQATGAKLSGMNKNNLKGVKLEHAVLDYALMDNLDLSNSHLTSASFIEASLHGANLSNATLVRANMTGVQLGTLIRLFALPLSTEAALNAGQVATISPYFTQHSIKLSSTATLNTVAANRVWQLNDASNHVVYTIRLETQTGSTQALNIYKPATAASLAGAYMPNAVLTGANLYGITANNIQFYGSNAKLDGSAILEEAKLNNSNLSTVNFTQAQLLGTNLSDCHLFNANFRGANLTPSASGGAADLSKSNLQGADFTDAQLYGANLANAAVAINTPTKGNPNQGGVYLFSLPCAGDKHTEQQYIAELNAAASKFSLNPKGDAATLQKYVSALETNNLGPLKILFLEQHPPIKFSPAAQIQTIEGGSVWQIVDGQSSYTLWTDIDESGNTELYAAPSLTNTRAAFEQCGIKLRRQASASIDKTDQQWLTDNDSQNPKNTSTGYMRFLIKLDGGVLDVYGTTLRIIRLGDGNQQEYDSETCNVTVLTVKNMNGDTICPNGAKLSTNQNTGGVQWDERWLRASAPPAPPTCVPTNNSWCPQTRTQAEI
jgi:uncharacterized protein YjbI with pentapeptide repeats